MDEKTQIVLKKVCVHNLKNVDLVLQSGQLIVFTGVSGSGKSSLAFDTIYAEGQRRYIESLSHQARRHLAELPKPKAQEISGIAPTIAIEQKLSVRTPRSTVGTLTGIYDFLRVLYARIGQPHCPISKEPVSAQSIEKIIAHIQHLGKDTKIAILAPYAKGKKGEFIEDFSELLSKGFTRLRVDGAWVDLSENIQLDGKEAHDVDLVIDRVKIEPASHSRIAEAVTLGLEIGKGLCSIYQFDTQAETLFSQFAYAAKSKISYQPLQPQDFSFNHPAGMCPVCHGLGIASTFAIDRIIDPNLSIFEDCCCIGSSYKTIRYGNIYENLAKLYRFSCKTPWKNLSETAKHIFLYGIDPPSKWIKMKFSHPEKKTKWIEFVRWKGVLYEAQERLAAAKSDVYRKNMAKLMVEATCPSCQGARIKPYPAEAKISGKKIADITALSLNDALSFFRSLSLPPIEIQIAQELLKEIVLRLQFLVNVGLEYLSLDRTAPSLSGGESQRVRLASQIGSGLTGAIYILDEPSIGLHPSDHHKLIQTLKHLRDQGNTVLVVEHDADTILCADTVVDVGPGAGQNGGHILFCGPPNQLKKAPQSITGAYLDGRMHIEARPSIRTAHEHLTIVGASHHNLQNLTVSIPLQVLVCITGVSGSGKSSLITEILYPALANRLHHAELPVGKHEKIEGAEHIDKVILVDQSPIGRTPRSNAATYIKLFDAIRDLFAELPESRLRLFTPGHFSFNILEGSCPYCEGMGSVRIDMDFIEDAWEECPQCKGKRFEPEILSVLFKGKSIADCLAMDVEQALILFENIPSIHRKLQVLNEVGLGYLKLGQPSTTLSGGEAQRIKLAKELVRPSSGKTVYIFDEPTTGLHFHDVNKLVHILQRLVDRKNTVIVIEHHFDLVKISDWVIDLGPGPGIHGGRLVGQGVPNTLKKYNTPTGNVLNESISTEHKKSTPKKPASSCIEVKGASQNNLQSISLSIPRNQITIFTGPSGSGKSSLAFETLYAEGQRRYTETLPAYSRSLVKQLSKPKVDHIEGLPPSIALEQKTGGLNPRSTAGTITEIYDLLRILYAHLGKAHCPETGQPIRHISKEFVVNKVLQLPEKEKIHILAPLSLQKKETFEELLERINKLGFLRIRLNGQLMEIDSPCPFDKHRKNELLLVIDRIAVDPKHTQRIYESITKAVEFSDGIVIIAKEKEDLYFNLSFAVETTGKSYPPITPQTFSFNHEAGMCLECQGLGLTYGIHLSSHKSIMRLSLLDICCRLFQDKGTSGAIKKLTKYFDACGIDCEAPLKHLSTEQMQVIFNGGPEKAIKKFASLRWIGLHYLFSSAFRMGKTKIREALFPLMSTSTCTSCNGARLNALARNVTIENTSIADFCHFNLEKAYCFMQQLSLENENFLQDTHDQICKHLKFLIELGLGYLSLDRSAPTLSGGELQRIRLARQLGSGLRSCLYVLDEPTIGLHPFNSDLLNQALKTLCEQGNTLLLVEHDPITLQIADLIVEFGPKAGKHGGKIVTSGSLEKLLKNPHSLTGSYLSGRKRIPIPTTRRPFKPDIRIEHASMHNLKNISIAFPKAAITCLTGVSGSGKSTLMHHLLKPATELSINSSRKSEPVIIHNTSFWGLSSFEKVVSIDQSPIGQTARSDVGTYTEIMPLIRAHFAKLPLAKAKGLQPRHFSSNHLSGMCRTCWGLGYKTVQLQFLPNVRVTCDACFGFRLNPIALEIRYKGKHLGEILSLTVEEALNWFSEIPNIAKRLQILSDVGLSYLCLGQELASLSGGEAQRLRLSRELSKREIGKTLYLIDEPTVGLHSEDIAKLLPIFHKLADKKNTLLIIEHQLDIIANADYVIDLGPDAGDLGGFVVALGTPEELVQSNASRTAPYLKRHLSL